MMRLQSADNLAANVNRNCRECRRSRENFCNLPRASQWPPKCSMFFLKIKRAVEKENCIE